MAKLLFVSHTSDFDGTVFVLLKILQGLRQEHEVMVIAPEPERGRLFQELDSLSISYVARPLTRDTIPWMRRFILREEVDLVYGNGYSTASRNALIAAKIAGRPFVWHIHEVLRSKKARRWSKSIFLRFADAIVAVSQACADSLPNIVPESSINIVYNGIDLGDFEMDVAEARSDLRRQLGVSPDTPIIINVGYVCARKGQAYAVQVLQELKDVVPEPVLIILGDVTQEPNYVQVLRNQIKRAGLEQQACLVGFQNKVSFFLAASDIYLHTAAWDPFPISVLEAMGAKLPVVAFAVDGVKEQVINGRTGCLVQHGDVKGLKQAIEHCLNNPYLRKQLGEGSYMRVRDLFTVDTMVTKIGQVIRRRLR